MDEQRKRQDQAAWLAEQRKTMSNAQWMASYQSWRHGGKAWNKYQMGGTDIVTCLCWYQHCYKPGSHEWRPAIIMEAVHKAVDRYVPIAWQDHSATQVQP